MNQHRYANKKLESLARKYNDAFRALYPEIEALPNFEARCTCDHDFNNVCFHYIAHHDEWPNYYEPKVIYVCLYCGGLVGPDEDWKV
jgi:hypothetical protein